MRLLVSVLLLLFVSGCATKQTPKKKIVYKYIRTTVNGWWQLSKIANEPYIGKKIKLRLNSKTQKFYGNDSCNDILGALQKVDKRQIIFGVVVGTMRNCEDIKTPKLYVNALQDVRYYEVYDPHLFLYDKNQNRVLEFVKSKREL